MTWAIRSAQASEVQSVWMPTRPNHLAHKDNRPLQKPLQTQKKSQAFSFSKKKINPPAMSFYNKLFARIYDPFMAAAERKKLSAWRKRLLAPLRGNILEVGAGTGVNFPFYGPQAKVLAVDPSREMLAFAERKKAALASPASIELLACGVEDAYLNKRIQAASLDAIVATLVLCTVPDPQGAYERFRNWLKPSGKLLILEHIHAQSAWRRSLEKAVNPLWKILAEGCHLTRDTDRLLCEAGFKPLNETYFQLGVRWYAAELTLQEPKSENKTA